MSISKSQFKSIALGGDGDVSAKMRQAGREISRDNGEAMFVTLWAGVLDAATGELAYCSAGHVPPYVVGPSRRVVDRLVEGSGPPLCVLDDFPYEAGSRRLSRGDTLCLITDGVIEATSATGDFYGRERLEVLLLSLPADAEATELGEAIRRDVARFTAGGEPADDIAILAIRRNGG